MTTKTRYRNYTWNGLKVSHVMKDGSLYWQKDIYSLVSPNDPTYHDGEDYVYGYFESEAFAWQWANDVWGDDKDATLEVRAASVIVAKTDGIPADAVYSEEVRCSH